MNYSKLAILVSNQNEFDRATEFLSKKNGNCRIARIVDISFPFYVFYHGGDNDPLIWNTYKKMLYLYNKDSVNFSDVEELNPYYHLIQAFKRGKTIQVRSIVLDKWVDIKDPAFEGSPDRYRIKVAHQHLLDAIKEGKIIQYKYSLDKIHYGHGQEQWFDVNNPTFEYYESQPNNYRIKPNPYQSFLDAFKEGKIVKFYSSFNPKGLTVASDSLFAQNMKTGKIEDYNESNFKIEPVDHYKVFKDALKEGKVVEYKSRCSGKWETAQHYQWRYSPEEYRIKPEPPKSHLVKYDVKFTTIRDKNPMDMLAEIQKLGPVTIWQIDAKPFVL